MVADLAVPCSYTKYIRDEFSSFAVAHFAPGVPIKVHHESKQKFYAPYAKRFSQILFELQWRYQTFPVALRPGDLGF